MTVIVHTGDALMSCEFSSAISCPRGRGRVNLGAIEAHRIGDAVYDRTFRRLVHGPSAASGRSTAVLSWTLRVD